MSTDVSQNNNEDQTDALCNHCGQAFKTFLHQMEEHNAEALCPSCGKSNKHDHPQTVPKAPVRKN